MVVCALAAAGCEPAVEGGPEVAVTRAELTVADCPAGYNVIQGTSASNTLTGTAGSDCILGHGGGDTIHGLGGNDFLIGGTGEDFLYGGDGNDALHGEDGVDRLEGQLGDDELSGNAQNDTLLGGDGNDTAYGGANNDTIEGNAGHDALFGAGGGDTIRGGDGNDRIFGEADADYLYGDAGDDIMDGAAGGDLMLGGAGHDVIQGGTQNDNLQGEDGNDAIMNGGGNNSISGGAGTDRCTGVGCELAEPVPNGCTQNSQCTSPQTCVVDVGVCLPCLSDVDGDGTCDGNDGCPSDAAKVAPGACGCGVADTDSDGDGTANCNDGCASDPGKTASGICGCGVSDADSDSDGTADCNDGCASDPAKVAAGVCGCGVSDVDTDSDGTADCNDGCASDPAKVAAGVCGCGVSDVDTDSDGAADCNDECDGDPSKTVFGACGCGVPDSDVDADGIPDCDDTDLPCVPGMTGAGIFNGDFVIDANTTGAALAALDGFYCITGSLTIAGSTLLTVDPLWALEAIGGSLTIAGNTSLENVESFENITEIGGALTVYDNDALESLDGLHNVTSVGAQGGFGPLLSIVDNASLPACWVWLLEDNLGSSCHSGNYAEPACDGNHGVGSCGALPPDFECVPGAQGPGVFDGVVMINEEASPPFNGSLADYGGVTCITGSLYISGASTDDLSALSELQMIGGPLSIGSTSLATLDGLEQLTSIGGALYINDNPLLTTLEALTGVTSLASNGSWPALVINDNTSLPACWVWLFEDLFGQACYQMGYPPNPGCRGNTGSASCGELPPEFACVPGASGPGVYDGSVYVSGGGVPPYDMTLDQLGGVTCITGTLNIWDQTVSDLSALASLQMIGGSLYVTDNESLSSLAGLENLSSIGGTLYLAENEALTSLAALDNVESLGSTSYPGSPVLQINDNASLPACWTWLLEDRFGVDCLSGSYPLADCRGNTGTGSCGELPQGFQCVPGASGPGVYDHDVLLAGGGAPPYDLTVEDLGGVACITGSVYVYGDTIESLSGLGTLEQIGGDLVISDTTQLASLDGLQNLRAIGGALAIDENALLTTLEPLVNLESVGANGYPGSTLLTVNDNPSLTACWAWMLEDVTGLACEQSGWFGPCKGNHGSGTCGELPPGFECAPGASGPGVYDADVFLASGSMAPYDMTVADLGGVTCITGSLNVYGETLADLSGLGTLEQIGGDLYISDTTQLATLAGLENLRSIGRTLYIDENAALTSLEPLVNLESVGANAYPSSTILQISDNPSLPACWAWMLEDVTGFDCQSYGSPEGCEGNHGSGTCGELPSGFECVPGASGPGVYDDDVFLADGGMPPYAMTIEDLGGVTCITGSLNVYGDTIDSLSGLSTLEQIGGDLYVTDTTQLATLDGLENLHTIGRTLYIDENAALTSLEPLTSLESLGASAYPGSMILQINGNSSLPACWAWMLEDVTGLDCQRYSSPEGCDGNTGIGSCGELPPGFECVPGASGPGVYDGSIYIADAGLPPYGQSLEDFGGLTCVTGSLNVFGDTVTSLSALGELEQVGGDLYISDTTNLTALAGLEDLHTIGGTLYLAENAALTSLEALLSLSSLGASAYPGATILSIYGNTQLPACWVALIESNTSVACSVYSGGPEPLACYGNDGAGSCPP